jgi:hypothetical protein
MEEEDPESTGQVSGSVAAVIGRMLDSAPGAASDITRLGKAASRPLP